MPQIAEIRMIDDAVWARIPVSGDDGRVQLLTDAEMTANDQKMARLLNEIERLRAALESCASWIDRWAKHVGACEGGDKCTCGRTAILYEAHAAIEPSPAEQKSNQEG